MENIKSNELRIGNLVSLIGFGDFKSGIYPVCGINGDNTIRLLVIETGESIGCFQELSIQPIPLTEDWLKRFGFVVIEDGISDPSNERELKGYQLYVEKFGHCFVAEIDNCFWNWFEAGDNHYSFQFGKLPYVHTLQNLIFALTSTELNLNDGV